MVALPGRPDGRGARTGCPDGVPRRGARTGRGPQVMLQGWTGTARRGAAWGMKCQLFTLSGENSFSAFCFHFVYFNKDSFLGQVREKKACNIPCRRQTKGVWSNQPPVYQLKRVIFSAPAYFKLEWNIKSYRVLSLIPWNSFSWTGEKHKCLVLALLLKINYWNLPRTYLKFDSKQGLGFFCLGRLFLFF